MTRPPGTSAPSSITARALHPGRASGPLLCLDEPVSFWGGVSADGSVIDVHHPQYGQSVTGTVLAMTAGRGSSSASSVLAEQIRSGAAPAAIVVTEPDVILVLGAAVAAELYDRSMPIVQVAPAELAAVRMAGWAEVDAAPAADPAPVRRLGDRGRDEETGRATVNLVVKDR